MRKIFFSLLLFGTLGVVNAQSKSEITAVGAATKKVKPDIVTLTVNVSKDADSEKEVLKQLNDEVGRLENFFNKVGISKTNVKISNYDVRKSYDDGKKKYEASTGLEIAFKLDGKVLDAFYGELQAGNYKDVFADYETSLSADLEKRTHDELVVLAIADARAKAETIAKALGVKIIGVSHASKYGREEKVLVDEVKFKPLAVAAAAAPSVFSAYEVKEIEEQEEITIIFEIGK